MGRLKISYVVIIINLIWMAHVVSAEPTAKTYIFAASHYMFQGSALDSLAKYFDVLFFINFS